MTRYHKREDEPDTETLDKLKRRRWWAKWISIGGVSAIAALIAVFPIIKSCFAYGHDLVTVPTTISEIQKTDVNLQSQIDILRETNYDSKIWQAKTDERLDNIEKLLTRVLDNQERANHYNPTPKAKDQP